MLGRVRDEARAISAREAVKELLKAFERNDLLTFASAIAFQVFFALIPLALFALALMSGLGLSDVWSRDIAPDLRESASPAAYTLIDDTVRKVLSEKQFFWLTIGAVITIWEMSGATRAIMDVFDRIYESDRRRSFRERYAVSIVLSIAAGALILAAAAAIQLAPLAVDGPVALLRWPLAVLLLSISVALLVRYAPADSHPDGWVSFGSLVVVVAWLGTSLAFTFYLTNFARYGSIFGALATIIVTFEYLYLASIAFLTGAQVDALVRERVEGDASGDGVPEREEAGPWTPASSTS
jgi:membrane protein